ncbi:MAG TPA: cysteine desulfurase family protein [Mucilaginibacter sp.]|nr:cysteine desulfurase family protein [Mucilaginibacter sp.]
MRVYFDNAATTPIDPEVLREMYKVMENHYGNPSSIHAHGREARALVERSRKTIANLLHTSPSEIFFTSGGTEGDNTAIRRGIIDNKIKHAITTNLEHHAVINTLEAMEEASMIRLSFVETDHKGNLNYDHLEELLKNNEHSFVSLMQANNELGTLCNMDLIGDLCEKYDAIYHSDTVQTVGHFRHDLSKLKTHFMVCSAHKLHGPKGIGFLHVSHRVKINPFIYGGAQERNMRGGTENIYGIVGLAKALEIAYSEMDQNHQYIQGLKSYMIEQLREHVQGVDFNGETDPDKSLYTVLNVSFPCQDMSDMLLLNLDIAGISASGGSACSSGTDIGSHVLHAIGGDSTRPSVRFSFSKYNTKEEVDFAVARLRELCLVSS